MQHETVIVLDFGGQYNQLIARRVRENNVYCEIYSYKTDLSVIKAKNPKGIIFTGGPNSVYLEDSPTVDPEIFSWGVPVLANFSGGFDKFVGPTGGFLISFPLMAYIIGLGVEHRDAFKGAFVTAVIVGTVVNYVVGVAMFVVVAHSTIAVGITACVLPFIPTAIIKAVLACAIGLNLRKRIPGLKA